MYRILLVDDEALIREGVSENVKWNEYGYELAGSCENGEEALRFIENQPVDVVLTDICMPYMDGIQLSEKISERYPFIKIIILSGYDDFEYAKKAIQYGIREYLLKPITQDEMGEVLTRLKDELDKERNKEKRILSMQNTYHRGRQLLYSDVFYNLLSGSKSGTECRKELDEVGLCLDDCVVYRVAIVEIDNYGKSGRVRSLEKQDSALMAFALYNISDEIVKLHEAGEVCQGKDHRTFILFTRGRSEKARQTVAQVCRKVIDAMNEQMGLAVNIGLGSYVSSMEDIYLSSEEAEEALEYHYVMGRNRILEIGEILEKKSQASVENVLDDVILHMKENDKDKIEDDFRTLQNMLRENCYDRQSVETLLQKLVNRMGTVRKSAAVGEAADEENQEAVLKEILNVGKLEEAVEILYQYCIGVAESLEIRKNVGGKKYAILATDYMEKNYGDCNLSLSSICAYLNISTSNFSSAFKAATGSTFMDVLIRIRMRKAKELLEVTDLKNYEIAERVGFNDPHYFGTAFKKMTGKSPTEYAKEMRR